MAAVSLFSNTNMAAVTSCENVLYSAWGVLLPKWVDTQYRYYNAYRIISDKIIYHYMVKVKYVASLLEIVKNIYLRRHWVIPEKQELLQKRLSCGERFFPSWTHFLSFPGPCRSDQITASLCWQSTLFFPTLSLGVLGSVNPGLFLPRLRSDNGSRDNA